MSITPYSQVKDKIKAKIAETAHILLDHEYDLHLVTEREFYDWMTGEIFSEDQTTLRDVLGNMYLMIHELVEISEMKKRGAVINTKVIVDSPRELVYTVHFYAMEYELNYAFMKEDFYWLKLRLGHHYKVLISDPWMPESIKPRAQEIWDKFKQYRD